jgi:hypothetical protein
VELRHIELLLKALPVLSADEMFCGYNYLNGALLVTLARTGRIDKLSGGLCRSEDFAAVKERMAAFMAAGFVEVCRNRRARAAGQPD